jgi:hypothetical protein
MSFNAAFYLDKYPDVLLGIAQKKVASAEAHWNEFGAAEGRDPNANFDTKAYFLNNGDVLSAGVNPLTHFLEFGAAEGRSPSPTFVKKAQFDTAAYAAANTDLAGAGITTPAALYEHFAKFGFAETRPGVQTTDGVAITDGVAGGTVGTTFTLTTNVDQGAAFTGTSSNDTFTGLVSVATPASNTVGAADALDGGNGKDTLEITVSDLAVDSVVAGMTTKNIETISVRNADDDDKITVQGGNFVGATEFVNDRSTEEVLFNSIGKADVTIKGNGSATNGATEINVGTTAVTDAFILNIKDGVKAGAINVNDAEADWTTATVNSTGAANTVAAVNLSGAGAGGGDHTIKTLTVNAATNLTTGQLTGFAVDSSVVISGAAAKVVLGLGNVAANVDSIDASGLTAGGVTVTLDNEADTKFVGGKGSDVVTTGNVAYVAANTAAINAGDGADTLVVDNALALGTAVSGAKFTGFEALEVKTNGTIDLDFIAGITSIVVDNAGGVDLNDVSTTQAGAITVQQSGALDIAVKGAATVNQIDTVKITADDGVAATSTIALGTPVLANVEKLELVAVDNLTVAALTGAASLTGVTASGAGTIGITTGAVAFAINTSIDASAATGAVTIDAGLAITNGLAITGSATAKNILTGSVVGDVLTGGAAADTIDGGGVGVKEVFTATLVTAADGTTIIFDGITFTAAGGNGATVASATTAFVNTYNAAPAANFVAVDNTGTVTFTQKIGSDITDTAVTDFTGDANGGGNEAAVVGAPGTQGTDAVYTADTYTGGAGADTFIVGTANATAAASADEIKDFATKSDKIDFQALSTAGSATTYKEATAAVADFAAAKTAADLAIATTFVYSAQQVGSDVYVFADTTADGAADQVVKLTGVSLAGIEFGDLVA